MDGANGFTCTCSGGYSGVLCQTEINECASSPCQNGGTCTDVVNGVTCACRPGFSGLLCQTNINECASTPCQNGATCVDGTNSFSCTCAVGWAGTLCQSVNDCLSQPCQNGGLCVDGTNSFTCLCTDIYYGTLCNATRQCANLEWTAGQSYTSNSAASYMYASLLDGLEDPTSMAMAGTVLLGDPTIDWHCDSITPPMRLMQASGPGEARGQAAYWVSLQKINCTHFELTCAAETTSGSDVTDVTYAIFADPDSTPRWRRVGCEWVSGSSTTRMVVDGTVYPRARGSTSMPQMAEDYVVGKYANGLAFVPVTSVAVISMGAVAVARDQSLSVRDNVLFGNVGVYASGVPTTSSLYDLALPMADTGVNIVNYGNKMFSSGPLTLAFAGGAAAPRMEACHADPSYQCDTAYSGPICDQPNLCLSSPCQNGGTCYKQNNGYTCYCAAGHSGTLCEV